MDDSTEQSDIIVGKLDKLIKNVIDQTESILGFVAEGSSIDDVHRVSELANSVRYLIDARANRISHLSYEPRIKLLKTRVAILESRESK